MYNNLTKDNNGLAAILVVIIIGAATLLMARGAAFLGLGELDMGQTSAKGNETYYLAEACLEEALLRLKIDNDFVVTDYVLPIGDKSCRLTVSGPNSEKTITATGINGEYQKILHAEITIIEGIIKLDFLNI
jgi:hypothetical protein